MKKGEVSGIYSMIRIALGAVVAIVAIILIVKLVGIFLPGNDEDESAKQNFEQLAQNLERLSNSQVTVASGEMIFAIPEGYYLVGYDAGMDYGSQGSHIATVIPEALPAAEREKLTYDELTAIGQKIIVKPPKECKGPCICMYKSRPDPLDVQKNILKCSSNFKAETRFASRIRPMQTIGSSGSAPGELLATKRTDLYSPQNEQENHMIIIGGKDSKTSKLRADFTQRNDIRVVFLMDSANDNRLNQLYVTYTNCPGQDAQCTSVPWNSLDSTSACQNNQQSICKYDSAQDKCNPTCVPICNGLIGQACVCGTQYYTEGYCSQSVHHDYYLEGVYGSCQQNRECETYKNQVVCETDPCLYKCTWQNNACDVS